MSRLIVLLISLFSGCAWWQAGINDPTIVEHATSTIEPYRNVADSIYPHAGIALAAIGIPLLILLGGKKKINET